MSVCSILSFSVLSLSLAAPGPSAAESAGCSQQEQDVDVKILQKATALADQLKFNEALHLLHSTPFPQDGTCPITPAVLIQVAAVEFRAGNSTLAIKAAERVLSMTNVEQMLSPKRLAVVNYILGGGYAAQRKYEKSEQFYLESVRLTPAKGEDDIARLSTIHAELSLLYLEWGRFRDSERSIQKSYELARLTSRKDKNTQVLRLDTVSHMQLEKGRISDALNGAKALVAEFATDKEVAPDIRAHLYRDYGELCFRSNMLEESVESLRKCMELERDFRESPSTSLTLATLAQAQTRQKRFDAAELNLRAAEQQVKQFVTEFPVIAAQVSIAAANCWQMRERWAETRAEFLRAAEILRSLRGSADLLQKCLLSAAAADHHLKNRREEKDLRKEAKELLASLTPQPQLSNTVDITTLRSSKNSLR